jgi:YgiT-type zinc finger domain-containing protein
MLQDLAEVRTAAHWSQLPEPNVPHSPTCGTPLVARGTRRRRIQTTGGRQLELERPYGTCPRCGAGFFPPR